VAPCPAALRLDGTIREPLAHHFVMLDQVFEAAETFDVIHFHIGYLHFPLARRCPVPQVTTLHGRLDIPDLVPLYKKFPEMPVVSISDDQRKSLPWANWQGTVHHGLPPALFSHAPGRGDYLAFLGRISPEKRVDRAIEIASRFGMKLKIAAKVDAVDRDYFAEVVAPLLDNPLVECVGEIDDRRKQEFLCNAYALLFPVDWPEPFGIVLIEAMSCGTPVIAFRRGSVPEIIVDGVNGFIVDGVDGAVEALSKLGDFDRGRCRLEFDKRFCVARMTEKYVEIYRRVIASATRSAVGTQPLSFVANGKASAVES
jgi:glycosyltransferase involved in cell wall biosynthesis